MVTKNLTCVKNRGVEIATPPRTKARSLSSSSSPPSTPLPRWCTQGKVKSSIFIKHGFQDCHFNFFHPVRLAWARALYDCRISSTR